MLAFADAALARMVIAPGRVFLSRGRGHARAASHGLLTHGILPTKSTTIAATPCPSPAAVATAPSPTAAARSNCSPPAATAASRRGSGTAATINRRRFDKAVVIVVRQVGRQAREIRGCRLTLHNVMVIEINRCPRAVEQRDVHDRQVIEMCEESVT